MTAFEVRIVDLAPMRAAGAHGFGPSPEALAWERILAFADAKGLLENPGARFFGYNDPNPAPGSPNYGYDQWITVGPDVMPEGEIMIREIPGGRYAVARCTGTHTIAETWKRLVTWCEDSVYNCAHDYCMEECLTPPGTPPERMVFDLYLPIAG
jgi:AraC family transcriptional regulator